MSRYVRSPTAPTGPVEDAIPHEPDVIAKISRGPGEPMADINLDILLPAQRPAKRGW